MHAELITAIGEVSADEWNALNVSGSPFLRHEFLHALEASESVCADTGWQPSHLLIRDADQRLLAAMPCYIKSHSYGEYVFDWSWANAYHRAGREYYPKLLTAVPFSPVSGTRLLLGSGITSPEPLYRLAFETMTALAGRIDASSWHVLFPERRQAAAFTQAGLLRRTACQYHWFNESYTDFEDFLSRFASRKRKNIRKERQAVHSQQIELVQLTGADIKASHWQDFYQFYHMTYYKRGGSGYLNKAFFDRIAVSMPEQLVLVLAQRQSESVGAALCFKDERTLYGRYWGCAQEYEYLHFEACYYQGIDYCIRNGLQHFDPGAQGEHKIQRGFIPVFTDSCHWLAEDDFCAAVAQFLEQENEHIEEYRQAACERLPFNQQYREGTAHAKLIDTGR